MTTIEFASYAPGVTPAATDRAQPAGLRAALAAWFRRWRQHRADRLVMLELASWDDHLLKDIGFTARDLRTSLHDRHYGIERMRQY